MQMHHNQTTQTSQPIPHDEFGDLSQKKSEKATPPETQPTDYATLPNESNSRNDRERRNAECFIKPCKSFFVAELGSNVDV
jgi:hypothetical protein